MLGTIGKFEKSTFQRYQVCVNRNLVGKVMAPGSRSVRAVFLSFSGEDSAKPEMLLANRELHVVTRVALFLKVLNLRINL
jgi:hypothetical protein